MKIKVTDILAAVGSSHPSTILGRYGVEIFNMVKIEPLRGRGYDQEVTAFFVRAGSSHYRNRISSAFERRIGGENWRDDLLAAVEIAKVEAQKYVDDLKARCEKRQRMDAARLEYAARLGHMTGRTVYTHRVVMGDDGPAGISFEITLKGTEEQVAEKYARVLALADEYTNKRTQI